MTTEVYTQTPFGTNELLTPSGLDLLDEAELHTEEAVTDAEERLEEATPIEAVEAALVEQIADSIPETFDADEASIKRELKRQRAMAGVALLYQKKRRPTYTLAVQYPRKQHQTH